MLKLLSSLVAAGSTFALAGMALGVTLDGAGQVQGWGLTPFTQPNGVSVVNGMTSVSQNNWSPVNYPNGVGHVPSPGGTTGERFDLEEVHILNTGSSVRLLLVASSPFVGTAGGSSFRLGDLLLDTDGNGSFDHGVVTQSQNGGLNAGGLYDVDATERLQSGSGSYRGTSVEAEIGAWAIAHGTELGQQNIETASFNYGGFEGSTYFYEYGFDLGLIGADLSSFMFQLAWGCGNDVIGGVHTMVYPEETSTPVTAVPEPTTALLGGMATLGLGLSVFRRRRSA